MKKQLIIALLSLALGIVEKGSAQSVAAKDGYGSSLNCSELGGRFCMLKATVPANRTSNEKSMPLHFLIDKSGHLVMQVSKERLTEEQDLLNFRNKFIYYVEEDVMLDNTIQEALTPNTEKPISIKQGMYPIIEWENHYYIRF